MSLRRPGRIAGWTVAALTLAAVLFLLVFDWNWLRSPIADALSRATGRTVQIAGDLSGEWRLAPRIRMEQVRLSNPEWADAPNLLTAAAVEVRIALLPLLARRIHLHELVLEGPALHLQRLEDGRATWRFDEREPAQGRDADDDRVVIDTLRIDRGEIRYDDAMLPAALDASIRDTADPQHPRSLAFEVAGTALGSTVKLAGETASLLSLRDPDRRIPLLVRGVFGQTKFAIEGELAGIATPAEGRIRYEASGPSLSLLEPVFRVPLPETPRYAVSGLLVRKGDLWETTDLAGKVGASDVSGRVSVRTGGARPALEAELRSSLLDLADLGPLIGGTNRSRLQPTREDETKLLPHRAFDPANFTKIDAQVKLRADKVVRVAAWPFDDFRAEFSLRDGRAVVDPLHFGMAGGRLQGRIMLDAREPPIRAAVAAGLANVNVARIARDKGTAGEAAGVLSGRIDLAGRGNSVGRMLGTADGRIAVLLADGNVPGLLPALVDLDGARVLANLLGSKPESVRCAAIDMQVKNGRATPSVAVVETDTTVLTLSGMVDLSSEALDLKLSQAPKKPSFLSVRTPILVGGTLMSPDLAPAPGPLAARAAAAAILGLVNPLAALFALIETGPGEDGTCPVVQGASRGRGGEERAKSGAHPGKGKRETPAPTLPR